MSEISDLLWLKSQEMAKEASSKQREWQMVKSAAVKSLESRGIPEDAAEDLLEKLASRAYPNLEADLEKSHIAAILEKAAQYVIELESKIDGLQKAAEYAEKAPSVEAISGTGAFTNEDLQSLQALEGSTLSKLASFTDQTPWGLGTPSNRPGSGMDAFTEFLTS